MVIILPGLPLLTIIIPVGRLAVLLLLRHLLLLLIHPVVAAGVQAEQVVVVADQAAEADKDYPDKPVGSYW